MGVNLWARHGGVEDLVGVSKIRKPPFSGAKMLVPGRVKHKQTWTLFFCMFQVRSQGRNYLLEDSFFSKCKIFYALVGGAGFWRGHWIFVKMFFYNTFGLRMSHKWKSCWELLWKSLKSPRNFKVEIGRMSQLNSYGGS